MMPLPTPQAEESRDDFIARCMAADVMNSEYPDEKQRAAICARQWSTKGADPVRKGYTGKTEDLDHDQYTMVVKISTDAVDRDKEVILPSGVDLKGYEANGPVMWAHDYTQPPIAKSRWVKGYKTDLRAMPKFDKRSPFSMEIFRLYADGFLNAWSIGLIPKEGKMRAVTEADLKKRPDWAGAQRIIEEWELLEYSAVPIPANPEALSLAISKGLSVPDSVRELVPESIQEGEPWNREPRTAAEHEAVICDINEFTDWTMRSVPAVLDDKKYINIVGRKKADETQAVYAVRYAREDWTPEEAQKHAKATYPDGGAFEPASRPVHALQSKAPKPAPKRTVRVLKPELAKPRIVRVVGHTSEVDAMVEAKLRGRVVWGDE